MTKIDLITGFLGSGKTTFLKMYAKYLMDGGEKLCIIENDFGAINVDMVLLKELSEQGCNLEMIIGGDGAEAHKRRLKTKLISMGMQGYDRVIIEPSGIFDPDELFDTLYEEPLDRWYEMDNVICILDSEIEDDISKETRFLLMSEAACAGRVVISKLDDNVEAETDRVKKLLMYSMEEFKCTRRFKEDDFIAKKWEQLDFQDFDKIARSGYRKSEYIKQKITEEMGYQTLFYFDFKMPETKLESTVKNIFGDSRCGRIFRIKGFIDTGDKDKLELNSTKNKYITGHVDTDRAVLIIIGEALNREELKKYVGEPSI